MPLATNKGRRGIALPILYLGDKRNSKLNVYKMFKYSQNATNIPKNITGISFWKLAILQ